MSSKVHFVLENSEPKVIAEPSEETLLPIGVWTPWAKVLCGECHGPMPGASVEEMMEPVPIGENWALQGWCDDCGREIWIDNKIALEQRMVRALIAKGIPAHMEQTGGMCSAAEVWSPGDEFFMMITPDECSMTIEGDHWCVGVYDHEAEWLEDEGVNDVSFEVAIATAAKIWGIWLHA